MGCKVVFDGSVFGYPSLQKVHAILRLGRLLEACSFPRVSLLSLKRCRS